MPYGKGGYGRGRRGMHDEDPGSPNMPAKMPKHQPDFGGGRASAGSRGLHSLDDSNNTLRKPRKLGSEGADGTSSFDGNADESIVMGKQNPRRSHS